MKTEILSQMGIINELNSMVVKAIGIEKQYLRLDFCSTDSKLFPETHVWPKHLTQSFRPKQVTEYLVDKSEKSMIEACLGLFGWFQLNNIKESQKHIKEHINASGYG